MSVRYLCVFILVVASALLVTADPCALANNNGGKRWIGSRETLLQCFNSIQYEPTRAFGTTHVLRQLLQVYSFTDISKNSGAPWNMQVDLDAELNRIDTSSYSGDYSFHSDIARLFNRLNDAHTWFGMPAPYRNCGLFKPFSLTTNVIDGQQRVYLDHHFLVSPDILREFLNFDPTPYVGNQVLRINGQDPMQYLTEYAQTFVGNYKDVNVRVNKLFEGDMGWGLIDGTRIPFSDYNTETLILQSGAGEISLTVPTLVACNGGLPGTTGVLEMLNKPLPVNIGQTQSEAVLSLTNNPDIHLETKERLMTVVDTPAYADQINKRIDDAFSSVFSSLHSMMDNVLTSDDSNELMLAQDQSSQQTVQNIRLGSSIGLTLRQSASDGSAQYLEYLDERASFYPILRLTTFAPSTAATEEYVNTIIAFRDEVQARKYDYVIIDVSKNGGGALCFSLMVQGLLVEDWAHVSVSEPENTLWQPYDLRQTAMTDTLFNIGYINATNYLNTTTGNGMTGTSFYTSPVRRTRGGQEGPFMQQVFFPAECSPLLNFAFKGQTHWPDNVLIITDGTCGSACALFVGKFINNKRGKVITHGGIRGQDIDAGSFAGGNVLDWPAFLGSFYTLAPGATNGPIQFTSSAFARFNFHEVYLNANDRYPQEFNRVVSEYRTYYWDAVHNSDINTTQGRQALATLYNTATQVWGDSRQTVGMTPVIIAVIVICSVIGAVGIMLAIIFIVRAVKKRRAKYQVYREDLSTPFHSLQDNQL